MNAVSHEISDNRAPPDQVHSRGVNLAGYSVGNFKRGRSAFVEFAWLVVQALLVSSWIPGSMHRRGILRCFGAKLGHGVVIKPGVRVKFPWRLAIGDRSWIGEAVWIDNLESVTIGRNCCVSQGAYLCTGNHNWNSPAFDLMVEPIKLGDYVWIGARAAVAPGARVGKGAVVTLGSVAVGELTPWSIYRGNPAVSVGTRGSREHGQDEAPVP